MCRNNRVWRVIIQERAILKYKQYMATPSKNWSEKASCEGKPSRSTQVVGKVEIQIF